MKEGEGERKRKVRWGGGRGWRKEGSQKEKGEKRELSNETPRDSSASASFDSGLSFVAKILEAGD